jgi:outer membrane protein assembly factor BamB
MYLPTGNMNIFALNAKTGTTLWEYVSDVDPKYPGCRANRSVDIPTGVFGTQKDASIIALDQKSGTKLWQTTVTFQGGVGLDSGLLSTGQSAAFEFNTPGTYNYFCTPHPWMLGQVIVDEVGYECHSERSEESRLRMRFFGSQARPE